MASRYIRRTVEGWMNTLTTPYYPTVNVEQNPIDPMWSTIDWGMGFGRRVTLCDDIEETGTIQVFFFGPTGIGDDALLQQAEADVEALLANVDPNGRLVLYPSGSAEDYRDENYYVVMFTLAYEYHP